MDNNILVDTPLRLPRWLLVGYVLLHLLIATVALFALQPGMLLALVIIMLSASVWFCGHWLGMLGRCSWLRLDRRGLRVWLNGQELTARQVKVDWHSARFTLLACRFSRRLSPVLRVLALMVFPGVCEPDAHRRLRVAIQTGALDRIYEALEE